MLGIESLKNNNYVLKLKYKVESEYNWAALNKEISALFDYTDTRFGVIFIHFTLSMLVNVVNIFTHHLQQYVLIFVLGSIKRKT